MKTNNNFHILIVDDEKLNIELAAIYLKEESYKLSFALNAKSAIESVLIKDIDLILLDINMPITDGFSVCKILKDDIKTKDIPIVFLTAQTDIEYISRAFELGGVDYINKPFNGVELKARVKTHLQNMYYLQQIKDKQSKLAQLSITDPLTKLSNNLYFDSQIKVNLTKNKKFWIIYIKINNFEKINNLFGFSIANKVIKLFAKNINNIAFANSTVSRLYGVSFGILLKDYDKKDIKKLGNALSLSIKNDKNIDNGITFSMVSMKVDKNQTTPTIYKTLQSKTNKALDNGEMNFLVMD